MTTQTYDFTKAESAFLIAYSTVRALTPATTITMKGQDVTDITPHLAAADPETRAALWRIAVSHAVNSARTSREIAVMIDQPLRDLLWEKPDLQARYYHRAGGFAEIRAAWGIR
ncbi:hypothetical protein ACFODL_15480 [Phenylobacterium terrae]|uniref:Uncharacterized protein n=1 Tax=Phenylobacterium terrae TaxID=2665495 RepID=A0ABW4N771_9CAUL